MIWEMVDWTQVNQIRVAFRYLVDRVINLRVLQNAEIFWTS